ncbi:hypothetical protein CATMIT_01586, partial [Catenibacterium mitsuokai DSM 15897]
MHRIAVFLHLADEGRAALLGQHRMPVAAGQAVEQAEQAETGGVAGAVVVVIPLRALRELPGVGHHPRVERVVAQRFEHDHHHVELGRRVAVQRLARVLEQAFAGAGHARVRVALHAEAAQRILQRDRLRPRDVGQLRQDQPVA